MAVKPSDELLRALALHLRDAATDAGRPDVAAKADEALTLLATPQRSDDNGTTVA
jgi:hypothetical protein